MSHAPVGHFTSERSRWQWFALAAWIVGTLVLGTVGYWKYEVGHSGHAHLLDALYHAAQLFKLHVAPLDSPPNAYIEVGRWMGAGLLWLAVIETAKRVFSTEVRALRLTWLKDHTVICGEGSLALDMVRQHRVFRPHQPVVVIAHANDTALLHSSSEAGAIVIVGDPVAVVSHAGLARAERLIVLFENDGDNIAIAVRASELSLPTRGPTPLRCYAQVVDLDLRASVRETHLLKNPRCDVILFDLVDDVTRDLLMSRIPLDHDGIGKDDPRQVHLIILGFGAIGRSVAINAARLGHFANGTRLRISVIDQEAQSREKDFLYRFPNIRQIVDLSFEALPAHMWHALDQVEHWCSDPQSVTTVAVCLENDALALQIGLRILPSAQTTNTRFALHMSRPYGLASLLPESGTNSPDPSIATFGWCDERCYARMLATDAREVAAAQTHARFRGAARSTGRTGLHDGAVLSWDSLLHDDYRESSRQQVDHLFVKLRAVGCEAVALSDPRPAVAWNAEEVDFDMLAELEHRRWNAERLLLGWSYAPGLKNEAKRTNPNIVEWNALTDAVKEYDYAAVRSIPDLLQKVQLKVCRQVSARA